MAAQHPAPLTRQVFHFCITLTYSALEKRLQKVLQKYCTLHGNTYICIQITTKKPTQ